MRIIISAATRTWRLPVSIGTEHYQQFGLKEGRSRTATSGPAFDPNYYLQNNPDVAAAGVNPYEHYQQFGAKEGRSPVGPRAPAAPAAPATPTASAPAPSFTPGATPNAPFTPKGPGGASGSATSPIASGFALGGPVAPVDPQSLIPKLGQEESSCMGVGGRQLRRSRTGYAEGGEVDKAEDIYVTGDQLAKQVADRFDQTLETDEKLRRGYEVGGYVDRGYEDAGTAAAPASYSNYGGEGSEAAAAAAAAEQQRREAEERQRANEEAAEADRRQQAQAVQDAERASAENTRQATAEPEPDPYQVASIDPNQAVPSPAGQLAGRQTLEAAKAQSQTDNWLQEVLDYSYSKLDPSELGQRTGYQLAQADTGVTTDATGAVSGAPSGVAAEPPTPPAGETPLPTVPSGAPPPPNEVVPPNAGWGDLLGAGVRAIGKGVSGYFANDPFNPDRPVSASGPESAKMKISDMVRGKDGFTPEQLNQMVRADPQGNWNKPIQELFDSFKGNPEGGYKALQSFRPIFDNYIAFAQAGFTARRPDAVARFFDQAHNFLPNNTLSKTTPNADGSYSITLSSELRSLRTRRQSSCPDSRWPNS